jgi:hypothetical protein
MGEDASARKLRGQLLGLGMDSSGVDLAIADGATALEAVRYDDDGFAYVDVRTRDGFVRGLEPLRPLRLVQGGEGALSTQEGGDHYCTMKIQPAVYSHVNGLGPLEHTVIKYVSRWRNKGGIGDLRKARHTLALLIELESKGSADE